MTTLQQTRFPNGIRVLSRSIPHAHSVALGVWLVNGTRHQAPCESGYAHLLEHLLFKGTTKLTAEQLTQRFAAMGGQVNGHTGRELSALYGTVPAQDAPELLDLLLDMLLRPRFDQADVYQEVTVIQQEWQETPGDSQDTLEDRVIALAWGEHPLAWPILGTPVLLREANAAKLHAYRQNLLQGERLLVIAAGAIPHAALLRHCASLATLPRGETPQTNPPKFSPGSYRHRSASSQSRLLWLMPVPKPSDPAYPALLLANQWLGGSTNGYLFRQLRERLGLVYQIHSRLELFSDAGLWAIYSRCAPEQAERCREIVEHTLAGLLQEGLQQTDLGLARRELLASLLIEEDRLENLMERTAREAIYLKCSPDMAAWRQQLRQITPEDIIVQLKSAWEKRLLSVHSP